MHVNQQVTEYGAFEFAKTINEDAAYQSISMGFGQTMGFNYKYCGYNSAKEMFDDYSKGELQQITGMMNFLKNYQNGACLKYIKAIDFASFSKTYNGSPLYSVPDNIELYRNVK